MMGAAAAQRVIDDLHAKSLTRELSEIESYRLQKMINTQARVERKCERAVAKRRELRA